MANKIIILTLLFLIVASNCFAGDMRLHVKGVDDVCYEYSILDNDKEVTTIGYSIKTIIPGIHTIIIKTNFGMNAVFSHYNTCCVKDNVLNEDITETSITKFEAIRTCSEYWFAMYYKP